ncbi:MAG: putative membrane protein YgcG [Candidatus Nanohaloarchaea archaeon]|jgi:uncharacterized membrane protein YgcG
MLIDFNSARNISLMVLVLLTLVVAVSSCFKFETGILESKCSSIDSSSDYAIDKLRNYSTTAENSSNSSNAESVGIIDGGGDGGGGGSNSTN